MISAQHFNWRNDATRGETIAKSEIGGALRHEVEINRVLFTRISANSVFARIIGSHGILVWDAEIRTGKRPSIRFNGRVALFFVVDVAVEYKKGCDKDDGPYTYDSHGFLHIRSIRRTEGSFVTPIKVHCRERSGIPDQVAATTRSIREKGMTLAPHTMRAASPRAEPQKKRALISVTDKRGIELFMTLAKLDWEILSTGGTATYLLAAGIPVTQISTYTGLPEMMDGRLKTLHHKVHGGLLGDLAKPSHYTDMADHGILPISLLAVNLYNFKAKPGVSEIDVGGPAMIRGAAKNFSHVTVLVDPDDYPAALRAIGRDGDTSLEMRRRLAAKAFRYTGEYDIAISAWFRQEIDKGSFGI